MVIRCLGVVRVMYDDAVTSLTPAQRRILAILVAAGSDGLTSDRFADELWRDDLPGDWEASTRMAISRMRRALPPGSIARDGGRYMLRLGTGEVDVWQLQALADDASAELPEQQVNDLLVGRPYADLDPSPLMLQSAELIATHRVRVLRQLRSHRVVAESTLAASRELVLDEPWRDDALEAVVALHVDHEAASAARSMVRIIEHQEPDGEALVPPHVLDLFPVDPGLDGGADPSEPAQVHARQRGVPLDAPRSIAVERSAVRTEVMNALASGAVLLTGESGSGKTVVMRAIARQLLEEGSHVIWCAALPGASAAFQPLLAAVRELRVPLEPLLDGLDDERALTRSWTAAIEVLERIHPTLPIILVVDDAPWIDSHSRRLVEFIAASASSSRVTVVVIGHADEEAAGWWSLVATVRRVGGIEVPIGAFNRRELENLIAVRHPESTSQQRFDLASLLLDRKASLPVIAAQLIDQADPVTLALPYTVRATQSTSLWTGDVAGPAREVGGVAAVLGVRFRLADVCALGGWTLDEIMESVDDLLDGRMIVAEERPDEFSFRHLTIRDAFAEGLGRTRARRLHVAAAALARDRGEVHAVAAHMAIAGPLLQPSESADAHLASARSWVDQSLFLEAVNSFASARRLDAARFVAADWAAYVAALDRSGGDAAAIREQAFDRAVLEDSPEHALAIALAGAPEADDGSGDDRRVDMLLRLDGAAFDSTTRARWAAALARELGLLGRHGEALDVSSTAVAAATTPDERFRCWLGGYASYRTRPANSWPPIPGTASDLHDPALKARRSQVETVRALLLGDRASATRHLKVFARSAHAEADPLRSWQVGLLEATIAFLNGEWSRHAELADVTAERAAGAGVATALSARAAQHFALEWMRRRHAALAPALEQAPPDLRTSLLARSARLVALADAKHLPRWLVDDIDSLVGEVVAADSPLSAGAASILASLPEPALSDASRARLKTVLEPLNGTALLVGAGFAHLGPASWSLANLATAPDERQRLLIRARDEADRWDLAIWSLRARLDLAELTADADLLDQCRVLAADLDVPGLIDAFAQPGVTAEDDTAASPSHQTPPS